MSDLTAIQHITALETELRDCHAENERLISEIDGLLRMASKSKAAVEQELENVSLFIERDAADKNGYQTACRWCDSLRRIGEGRDE